jgi:hypothetical protein
MILNVKGLFGKPQLWLNMHQLYLLRAILVAHLITFKLAILIIAFRNLSIRLILNFK